MDNFKGIERWSLQAGCGIHSPSLMRCWRHCRYSIWDCPGFFHVVEIQGILPSVIKDPQQCVIKKTLTNLCFLVIFTSRQYDVKNSMRSATLCVHVGGRNRSGLIAFNHQCLYILKKKNQIDIFNQFLGKLEGGLERFKKISTTPQPLL